MARTDLERQTGLTVTIDDIEPVALSKGEPLRITGRVSNFGTTRWRDAQVYLEVAATPATTNAELDAWAAQGRVYGIRLVRLGLFDEIGAVRPGETSSYRLDVPFYRLPIDATPGVYHVGVSVLAQNEAGRDTEADARVDTLVPMLPTDRRDRTAPTPVLTLIPLTAPVLRQSNGNFLDDDLVRELSADGRLRNVLAFAQHAPPGSLELVLDPALLDAVHAMRNGYVVQSLAEAARGDPGRPGTGQLVADTWQRRLNAVARRQSLSLLPWGNPAASALAAGAMPGIVRSAVAATQSYATRRSLDPSVVGWDRGGFSTRRGLAVTRRSGTAVQVVAARSLRRLPLGEAGVPPATVTLPTSLGQLTALVTQSDVAGLALTAHVSVLQFRQHLIGEATVRSLVGDPRPDCAVFAFPFDWDPGLAGRTLELDAAYRLPTVKPVTVDIVDELVPTPYDGPVELPVNLPPYPSSVLSATASLRDNGRVFTGMLRHRARATDALDRQLGLAGSAAWRSEPRVAAAMIRQQAGALADSIAKVTVTGPAFVALSSASGPFPLTVTNGLSVPIKVRVDVRPQNPALQVDSIESLELAAGQRRDVQVVSRAEGSGLTQVRVRLATPNHRPFGEPWTFNVRATQFGVVIWVAMGAGAAVLFGAAALRIYRRIRASRSAARAQLLLR